MNKHPSSFFKKKNSNNKYRRRPPEWMRYFLRKRSWRRLGLVNFAYLKCCLKQRTLAWLHARCYRTGFLLDSLASARIFNLPLNLLAMNFCFCLDSTVFSSNHKSNPEMKKQWLVAKGLVEIVDMIVCQLEHHLTDTHLTQMMFCNVFRRHFSSRHPLYTIIQTHCQGTTPATMLGLPKLIKENQYTDNLFYFGGKGARKLVNKHYIRQHYDDTDFRLILKVKTPFLKKSMCIWSQTTFWIRLPFC